MSNREEIPDGATVRTQSVLLARSRACVQKVLHRIFHHGQRQPKIQPNVLAAYQLSVGERMKLSSDDYVLGK